MPFVPVPNTALLELRFTFAGQKCANTIYVEGITGFTSADLTAISGVVSSWWNDNVKALVSSAVELVEIYARDLSSQFAVSVITPAPAGSVGTNTNTPALPNSNTIAITFRTGLAGRSFRGRNYILGLTEGQVTGNDVLASVLTAYENAYNALKLAIQDAGYEWVVVSRVQGGVDRVTGVTTPITFPAFHDSVIDVQRRRLPGRGA